MKIKDLIEKLQKLEKNNPEAEVQLWLPGTYIGMIAVFIKDYNTVLIEGNVVSGGIE